LLLHLKRTSQQLPDIDAFSLQMILTYYLNKLKDKLTKIKEHCKQNNLEGALDMRSNFLHLKTQLEELESRSTITAMVSSYFNQNDQADEDLMIF
jgi:hypothetical protein